MGVRLLTVIWQVYESLVRTRQRWTAAERTSARLPREGYPERTRLSFTGQAGARSGRCCAGKKAPSSAFANFASSVVTFSNSCHKFSNSLPCCQGKNPNNHSAAVASRSAWTSLKNPLWIGMSPTSTSTTSCISSIFTTRAVFTGPDAYSCNSKANIAKCHECSAKFSFRLLSSDGDCRTTLSKRSISL